MSKILVVIFFLVSTVVYAEGDFVTAYIAKLSMQDHVNSRGTVLNSVAGILQQDRANFHKYNKKDPEDEYDSVFTSYEMRSKIASLLKNGKLSKEEENIIINSEPMVEVEVYSDRIEVFILNADIGC